MTDTQIWLASLLMGTLPSAAYSQLIPRLDRPSSWSRRTHLIFGGLCFIASTAAGHIVSSSFADAGQKTLTKARDTGHEQQRQADEVGGYVNQL